MVVIPKNITGVVAAENILSFDPPMNYYMYIIDIKHTHIYIYNICTYNIHYIFIPYKILSYMYKVVMDTVLRGTFSDHRPEISLDRSSFAGVHPAKRNI